MGVFCVFYVGIVWYVVCVGVGVVVDIVVCVCVVYLFVFDDFCVLVVVGEIGVDDVD